MVLENSLLKGILVKEGSDRVSIPKNDQLNAFVPVEIDLRTFTTHYKFRGCCSSQTRVFH